MCLKEDSGDSKMRRRRRRAVAGMFVWGIMHANIPTATRLSHHQILKRVKMLMSTQLTEPPSHH